jgi:hypothetical protein
MGPGTILFLRSLLTAAIEAASKVLNGRMQNLQWRHQTQPLYDHLDEADAKLKEAREHLDQVHDELPDQEEQKTQRPGDTTKVRAHKRTLKKKQHARTLEEAGGDPSKLMSVEEAADDPAEFVAGFKEVTPGQKPPVS